MTARREQTVNPGDYASGWRGRVDDVAVSNVTTLLAKLDKARRLLGPATLH